MKITISQRQPKLKISNLWKTFSISQENKQTFRRNSGGVPPGSRATIFIACSHWLKSDVELTVVEPNFDIFIESLLSFDDICLFLVVVAAAADGGGKNPNFMSSSCAKHLKKEIIYKLNEDAC